MKASRRTAVSWSDVADGAGYAAVMYGLASEGEDANGGWLRVLCCLAGLCADDSSVQAQEDVEVVCGSSSRVDGKVITLASVQARKLDEHLKMAHLKQAKRVVGDGIRNLIMHVHVGYMVPPWSIRSHMGRVWVWARVGSWVFFNIIGDKTKKGNHLPDKS